MGKWETRGVVTGGAAAALSGLLFVAVTLRIDTIAAARDLSPTAVSVVLIGVGGALAAVGWSPGLYVVVPGVVAALVGGVVNTWLFLLKIPAAPES